MIEMQKLKKRDQYPKQLLGFKDTEPVKVITGIRRGEKSSLLKQMIQHLQENGIQPEQIVEMNFGFHDFPASWLFYGTEARKATAIFSHSRTGVVVSLPCPFTPLALRQSTTHSCQTLSAVAFHLFEDYS